MLSTADFIHDIKIVNFTQAEVYSINLVLTTNAVLMLHLETVQLFLYSALITEILIKFLKNRILRNSYACCPYFYEL